MVGVAPYGTRHPQIGPEASELNWFTRSSQQTHLGMELISTF